MKVLITPTILADLPGRHVEILREAGFDIVYPTVHVQLSEADLLRELPGITATLAGSEPYTRRAFEAAPSLRVIARAGVGFDAVNLEAALDHGVAVTTTPGANQDAVAEHTLGLMLALAKSLVSKDLAIKAGQWPREPALPLRGRTLGIAGLGRIGQAVAIRAASFGMRLLASEPFPDLAFARRHGVTLVPFESLLAESDFVSLHIPLLPESHELINRRTLALMKPGALLINTARGKLICEADLVDALRSGQLGGAALDVFEHEPPGRHPLFEFDNVLCTPHTAGVDVQSRDDMALLAAQAIVALSRGEWPTAQVVNPAVRSRFRW